MPRTHAYMNPRFALGVTSSVLVVLALLPPKAISWLGWIASPVNFVLFPIQNPLDSLVKWTEGSKSKGDANGPDADLVTRIEQLKFELLNAQEQNDHLRQQIMDLQRGLALNPDVPRQVYAPIIGGSADLSSGVLTAKAGEREGIEVGSVAVAGGVNLVGRVTKVTGRYSLILPITRKPKTTQFVRAVVMLTETDRGPLCELAATGSGTLAGTVMDRISAQTYTAVDITPGMIVRLADTAWPGSSQMLIVGEVKTIETEPTGHRKIVVEPRLRLDRVSEVWLRVTGESDKPGGAGSGGGGT
ncbi:MAG: hypothetical protein H7210_10225 [Pyrinomonadaceae bacterium]|nr:hypothetical protein [Phycisphaerales bacterium]